MVVESLLAGAVEPVIALRAAAADLRREGKFAAELSTQLAELGTPFPHLRVVLDHRLDLLVHLLRVEVVIEVEVLAFERGPDSLVDVIQVQVFEVVLHIRQLLLQIEIEVVVEVVVADIPRRGGRRRDRCRGGRRRRRRSDLRSERCGRAYGTGWARRRDLPPGRGRRCRRRRGSIHIPGSGRCGGGGRRGDIHVVPGDRRPGGARGRRLLRGGYTRQQAKSRNYGSKVDHRISLLEFVSRRLSGARRAGFLVADVGTQHPYFEKYAFGFQPLAEMFEVLRRELRRRVRDIQQHPVEIVEDGRDRGVSRMVRGLAVQPVLRKQILGPRLGGGNIDRSLGIGVHQLDQHHLGTLEVIPHCDQQNALAHLLLARRLDSGRASRHFRRRLAAVMREEPSRQERSDQHGGEDSSRCQPPPHGRGQPTEPPPRRNLRLDAAPELGPIFGAAFGNRQRIDRIQHALQRAVGHAAIVAGFQVLLAGESLPFFSVIMQNQLFFTQVFHLAPLITGSRARLSFCTARNTLCLAAPGWHSSTRLTSSMHMPSKCRSTKAVRYVALSSFMASATRSRTSPLNVTRSGDGSFEGSVTTGSSISGSGWATCSDRRFFERTRSSEQLAAMRYSHVPKLARSSNFPSWR